MTNVATKACRHGPMMYFVRDRFIGRSLELYGEFSEGEFELFQQLITPGMTVLDVGANIGVHTVGLSRLVGGAGRVVAFEPQRGVYHVLCGNLALNGCHNVDAHLAALGRVPGTIKVPRIDYTSEGNFGGLALDGAQEGDVVVQTIDGLALSNCGAIKIDVEGMELDVLTGALATLARHRPLLYVENDRREKSSALIEFLLAHDYRLYWHLPRLFNPQNFFKNDSNVFGGLISINMLGVPSTTPIEVKGAREIRSPADWWESPAPEPVSG